MKRIKQLQPLSMEHHLSLSLALKSIKTANKGEEEAIKTLCEQIVADYPEVWCPHFEHEEIGIFIPYADRSEEIQKLCQQLTAEHKQFDHYFDQMKNGNYSVLLDFGTLLQSHTRMEEGKLFPLISEALSEEELDGIYQLIR